MSKQPVGSNVQASGTLVVLACGVSHLVQHQWCVCHAHKTRGFVGVSMQLQKVIVETHLKWQKTWIAGSALGQFYAGIRAEIPLWGALEMRQLALYLMWRGEGLTAEVPAVRKS